MSAGTALAVIPARGGSRRVPRKNIREMHGRPLLAYSVEAALRSGLFARVVVSTDDAQIAAVALLIAWAFFHIIWLYRFALFEITLHTLQP